MWSRVVYESFGVCSQDYTVIKISWNCPYVAFLKLVRLDDCLVHGLNYGELKNYEGCFLSNWSGLWYQWNISHGFTSGEQNHGFSHISNETPCGKAALVVDFCHRLVQHLKLNTASVSTVWQQHNTANHTTHHHTLNCQTNFPAFVAASDLAWMQPYETFCRNEHFNLKSNEFN